MISYNPREWFRFILTFHKEDTFRKLLPMIVAISVYSFIVACFEFWFWQLDDKTYVRNLSMLHNLLGFVLSLLLVFRTNSAYDRWWEGSLHWNAIVNTSRNLAMKINSILDNDDADNRAFWLEAIPLFAFTLRDHLRASADFTPFRLNTPNEAFATLDKQKHQPLQVLNIIYSRVFSLQKEGKLNGEQLLVICTDLEKLTDICGACERIKNTPIPSSYSIFVKKFVYIYIMTLPFGFIFSLGFYVVPVVAFIYYVLASLEMIAEEIEDPFGDDANDIPTDKIAVSIKNNIEDIFRLRATASIKFTDYLIAVYFLPHKNV